jgi:hypothetical protein
MLPLHRRRRTIALAALALSAFALSACDSLNLEGKVFDWMGISGSALDQKNRDPQMADRAPLVVPPYVNRLPEPGSGKTGSEDVASLNDPELKKAAAAKERERLHLAYCRGEIQWKERALKNSEYGSNNKSPYGPCPSLFGGLNSVNKQ